MESELSTQSAFPSGLQLLEAGGPVVGLLLVLSVIALTIIAYKLIQFALAGLGSRKPAEQAVAAYRAGDADSALATAEAAKDPVSRALAIALRGRRRTDLSDDAVREEVARCASRDLDQLRRHINALELIGTMSPLIGLLGTVLGMIQAFQAMEQAGRNVDPAVLSGGIWAALLTTAVGLIVAIPVVTVATWLDRTVSAVAERIEDAVTSVFAPDLSPTSAGAAHEPRLARA